ncbi:MAG: hypothetical protein RSE61_01260 [Anaerovoracaceae bacterium]
MKAFISNLAHKELQDYLTETAHCTLSILSSDNRVYSQVSTHPDIFMCKLGVDIDSPIHFGNKDLLGFYYPANIRYNGCSTGKFFIHNLKYTDSSLLNKAKSMGQILVDIKQGYAKCNILPVDQSSIITSDVGIASAIKEFNKSEDQIDVLLIESGHIKLQGFDYGFIGGASGILGKTVIFNGNLAAHPDYEKIKAFISSKGKDLIYFQNYQLEDIGSIIFED